MTAFRKKKKKIFAPPFPYEAAGFSKAYTVSTVFLGCRLFFKIFIIVELLGFNH